MYMKARHFTPNSNYLKQIGVAPLGKARQGTYKHVPFESSCSWMNLSFDQNKQRLDFSRCLRGLHLPFYPRQNRSAYDVIQVRMKPTKCGRR